jgi:hypothetical protein
MPYKPLSAMSGVRWGPSRTTSRPSTRMRGGDPTFRCRSDPLAATSASSQVIMLVRWLSLPGAFLMRGTP